VRPHRLLLTVVTCSVVLLAACDTDDATGSEETSTAATEVDVIDNGYDPGEVEVSAGDTVQWTNVGDLSHTVTFEDGPDSGSLSTDERFSHTFDQAGEYAYACTIHPAMTGTVTVSE
jgi:plastocyanin